MPKNVLFWGSHFRNWVFFLILRVLRSSDCSNQVFSERSLCVSVINIMQIQITHQDILNRNYIFVLQTLVLMSQYTMGRNPSSFSEPNDFIPERWQRTGKGLHQNLSHGCMPFGTGARSCIGKRVAELKMRMLIVRVSCF